MKRLVLFLTLVFSAQAGAVEGRRAHSPESLAVEHRAWLERIEQARARYEAFAARGRARLARSETGIETGLSVAPPPSHLEDSTLARGDVIVTRDGLLIFNGAGRFPYAPSDFRRLDAETGARTPQLRAIEASLRR